ncbi:hypothetical protein RBS60_04955 [Sinomonas sp. ASV486]|uniref:hypothetical protein n=1 Tax=Sinomonas sp. ASV486 TaxID=3051170 RepID=UPI0027DBF414|nr:hypothetical protein [Sinomonas sp. ASV486]MDQ4489547.1 hypothetical protein [Sinomonas sp. ASV486]
MNIETPRRRALALGAALSAAVLTGAAMPALAAATTPTGTADSYTVKTFAAVGSETKPDDIVRLGDSIYVAFQNGVGSNGEPAANGTTASTIQQYSLDGKPGASWNITGKIDGMGADAANSRLLVTTNEDGNSSFHTLTPAAGTHAVKTYAYTGLTHGGGTDAISVYQGKILVSGSNPATASGPAVYQVTLSGSAAALTPVFRDNSTAQLADGAQANSTTLALTDPDSNTVVPSSSPRFANDFMLDSQGDQQLIFANSATAPQLQVLNLNKQVDDTVFASGAGQTLWLTDPDHNTVDAVTGNFASGTAVSTVTPKSGANYLASLNLDNGTLTPIAGLAAVHPKGLLFTSAG